MKENELEYISLPIGRGSNYHRNSKMQELIMRVKVILEIQDTVIIYTPATNMERLSKRLFDYYHLPMDRVIIKPTPGRVEGYSVDFVTIDDLMTLEDLEEEEDG